jgi:hypothetical protein
VTVPGHDRPNDPRFLPAQEGIAAANAWLSVQKLNAESPFPMLDVREEMANVIGSFVAQTYG